MYSAKTIAAYVVTKCTNDASPITNVQLQKILYYIQLNFIKEFGYPAFREVLIAGYNGPYIPEIYREFMQDSRSGMEIINVYPEVEKLLEESHKKVIDIITEKCRELYVWELIARSQRPDSPWAKVFQTQKYNEIPIKMLEEYITYKKIS